MYYYVDNLFLLFKMIDCSGITTIVLMVDHKIIIGVAFNCRPYSRMHDSHHALHKNLNNLAAWRPILHGLLISPTLVCLNLPSCLMSSTDICISGTLRIIRAPSSTFLTKERVIVLGRLLCLPTKQCFDVMQFRCLF